MNYAIKGLLVFGMLGIASLAFAVDNEKNLNNNNNTPINQRELTQSDYIQKQLEWLRKDPNNNLPGILTPEGMKFVMEELPLDLQKEIAREVLKSLPVYSKILQKVAVGHKEFTGHIDWVTSVAFSPDSKYVVTGSCDKTACLWNAKTGEMVYKFTGHKQTIASVAFSFDSKYVVTGSCDKTARLWNVETKKMVYEFIGHTDTIKSVTFSPDGRYIVTGSYDKTARLWNVETGKMVYKFTGHTDQVTSVAFSSEGKHVLTGSGDKTARLWNVETGEMVHEFTGYTQAITSVASSSNSNGKYVVTGSWGNIARLWDVETKKMVYEFTGHTDQVTSVAFSPDSKYVLTGSHDTTARLWDISELKNIDNLLNKITISQLYLLMLIGDELKRGKRCELSSEMKSAFNSFNPKIKKILDELIQESESCTIV